MTTQQKQSPYPGLFKVTEEVGELIEHLGKLVNISGKLSMRPHGDHWKELEGDVSLKSMIEEEIADVLAITRYLVTKAELDSDFISQRIEEKAKLFKKWGTLAGPTESGN